MSFTDLHFLFLYFPLVLGINYLVPAAIRNYWLLAASIVFYIWGEPSFSLWMMLLIFLDYVLAILIASVRPAGGGKAQNSSILTGKRSAVKQAVFILALILNIGSLAAAKYMGQMTSVLAGWFPFLSGKISPGSLILPLGISFITFQSLGYLIDVYRGKPAEKNPAYYALFIMFFPQLIQGPILRYEDFRPQIENRITTPDLFSSGVLRFLTGFNQKILLANVLSGAVDAAFSAGTMSVGMAWFGVFAYSLQLYFDFSGYSDMAIGLGKMFGFQFKENFDFPYISKSISEFWRRWHISLGSWFRDYVYFPLGGSRTTKLRQVFNLLIVWLLTGIWHGTDGTFLLWGILHGCMVIFEKLTKMPEKVKDRPVLLFFYRVWVLLIVIVSWMLFRAENMHQAFEYGKCLIKLNGNPWRDSLLKFNFREYLFTLFFAVFAAFPLCSKIRRHLALQLNDGKNSIDLLWFVIQLILAVISISCLVIGTHNPFIYSNF
ncbi:MAG: MBOAT family protein [Anaerolineaceae bacterium]|nr:MBOAT family protein [Anaerolineaceae bacterium]